ncbi:MAG TPA: metallophosphoesterase family protein [Arachidicoccus sp.]|nr:metallophosphoesterase family protein [Arachidicoccus sp.]
MKIKSNRRKFINTLCKVSILPVVAPTLSWGQTKGRSGDVRQNEGLSFICPPYLQSPTSNSMAILWMVNRPSFSWVEYGLTKDRLDHKAVSIQAGLVDANNTMNKIPIRSLIPATKYYYRVCSKEILDFQPYNIVWGEEIKSDIFEFKTWPEHAKSVSWLVFNDIHDRPESFPLLYRLADQPDSDFVFLNGDMFNYDTDQQQFVDHLIKPLTALFASESPFFYSRGNHETRGRFARHHGLYFDNPTMDNKFFYSYILGPVHFIVLDTGEDKTDADKAYNGLVAFDDYRQAQAEWLEKQMQTEAFKKAPFRVVIMHIPTYESGDWHGTMHSRELFNPLFNKGKIDLLISGHTHKYGTYSADPLTHHYPIVIGGGPKDGKRTVIKVKATHKKLELKVLRDDGEVVKEVHLDSERS